MNTEDKISKMWYESNQKPFSNVPRYWRGTLFSSHPDWSYVSKIPNGYRLVHCLSFCSSVARKWKNTGYLFPTSEKQPEPFETACRRRLTGQSQSFRNQQQASRRENTGQIHSILFKAVPSIITHQWLEYCVPADKGDFPHMQGLSDSHRAQNEGAKPLPPHNSKPATLPKIASHVWPAEKMAPKDIHVLVPLERNRDSQGKTKRTQVKEFSDVVRVKDASTGRAPWNIKLDPAHQRNL